MLDLTFYDDVTQQMNERTNHFASEIFAEITVFERKFRLCKLSLRSNNVTHFQSWVREGPHTDANKYTEEIIFLNKN
jgi:hypothetical protein